MSTTTIERVVTPEDLLRITDRPMPELVRGRLVERAPMGQKSDAVAFLLGFYVAAYVLEHGLGLMNGARGSYQIFPDDPKKVRIPDVSFTRADRVPPEGPAEGHARVAPDLVVEVVSPHDGAEEVDEKIADYLAADVALIWVAYPETCTVHVYRADGTGARLRIGDVLDGETVLPGFQLPLDRLFTKTAS